MDETPCGRSSTDFRCGPLRRHRRRAANEAVTLGGRARVAAAEMAIRLADGCSPGNPVVQAGR